MKEPYGEGPATHPDPESCAGHGNMAGEALTGAHAGQPLSSEITSSGVPGFPVTQYSLWLFGEPWLSAWLLGTEDATDQFLQPFHK